MGVFGTLWGCHGTHTLNAYPYRIGQKNVKSSTDSQRIQLPEPFPRDKEFEFDRFTGTLMEQCTRVVNAKFSNIKL